MKWANESIEKKTHKNPTTITYWWQDPNDYNDDEDDNDNIDYKPKNEYEN